MDTTPVHPRLWHRDFWLLAIADLLLTMTMYMVLILLPQWICASKGQGVFDIIWVVLSYALGLFALGPFCNYFVQKYRRNHVYVVAAFGVVLSFLFFAMDSYGLFGRQVPFEALLLVRFFQGASFGLAQMVLLSTLTVDVAESAQRTDANHALSWFSRLATALGPLAGYELMRFFDEPVVFCVMAGMSLVAMLLVLMAKIPFKAPDEDFSKFSFDRFFLTEGIWLFLNSLLFSSLVGVLLFTYVSAYSYLMLLVGFYLALHLSSWFNSEPSNIRSQMILATIFIAAFSSMYFLSDTSFVALSFILWGLMVGLVSSLMSVLYIRVSRHCKRGTSQSTYFLSWESGVSIGAIFVVLIKLNSAGVGYSYNVMTVIMTLFFLSAAFFYFITRPWCIRHHLRDKV